jgi:hypothetical protein
MIGGEILPFFCSMLQQLDGKLQILLIHSLAIHNHHLIHLLHQKIKFLLRMIDGMDKITEHVQARTSQHMPVSFELADDVLAIDCVFYHIAPILDIVINKYHCAIIRLYFAICYFLCCCYLPIVSRIWSVVSSRNKLQLSDFCGMISRTMFFISSQIRLLMKFIDSSTQSR